MEQNTDDELRAMWRAAGGSFHGPKIETGTMPEAQLLPFLRGLVKQTQAASMCRAREEYTDDQEREWERVWRDIVAPLGVVDIEQLKKELCDFSMLLHFVPRVYEHVTGGRISKPNTLPSVVCSVADDHSAECAEDDIAEARRDARIEALEEVARAMEAKAPSTWPGDVYREAAAVARSLISSAPAAQAERDEAGFGLLAVGTPKGGGDE